MSEFLIGLTGGLASGKSTVAELLRRAGWLVVDADGLVADLYRAGGAGAEAVARRFGSRYLDSGGAVDHQRLAQLVFTDAEARRHLEEIVHPLVRERFRQLAAAANGTAVLEATLLVEAGYAPDFDLVVTVEASGETRLRRARERGMSEAAASARLEAQGDGRERRSAADLRIDNDGTLEDLEDRVAELMREVERRLEAATIQEDPEGRSRG